MGEDRTKRRRVWWEEAGRRQAERGEPGGWGVVRGKKASVWFGELFCCFEVGLWWGGLMWGRECVWGMDCCLLVVGWGLRALCPRGGQRTGRKGPEWNKTEGGGARRGAQGTVGAPDRGMKR